jgi:hypothetical protein
MNAIRHSTFVESTVYPIWSWNATARRERKRESIRQRAEEFINEIGVDKVVSVTEHAPSFGPFSVVVWYREAVNTDDLVLRAADDKHSA